MEQIFEYIRDFILNVVNEKLSDYESTGVTLPKFVKKGIVFGSVDVTKYNMPVICSVLPDSQEEVEEEETLNGYATNTKFYVSFLCRSADYETLIKRICRYTSCFWQCAIDDYTLSGTVINCTVGNRKFYPDAGTAEQTMTASEIEFTVQTNTEIGD